MPLVIVSNQENNMTRAIAITQQDSLKAAIDSAVNTAKLINDFMYGTPERAKLTTLFALGVAAVGAFLQSAHPAILTYCS